VPLLFEACEASHCPWDVEKFSPFMNLNSAVVADPHVDPSAFVTLLLVSA